MMGQDWRTGTEQRRRHCFPATLFKGPALGGIFIAGARDLRLVVGAGDPAPSGAMILRFPRGSQSMIKTRSRSVPISAKAGSRREAVLRIGPDGLSEIAVEGTLRRGAGALCRFRSMADGGAWRSNGVYRCD